MKTQAAGERLFPGGTAPEAADRANQPIIKTHHKPDHLEDVIEHRRTFVLQLRALDRVLEEAGRVAKTATKSSEKCLPFDGVASVIGHNLEQEKTKLTAAIRRHDREIASLEAELAIVKRTGV